MEAAVSNFLRQGDKVLVIRGGKFGERWGSIAQAYGLEPRSTSTSSGARASTRRRSPRRWTRIRRSARSTRPPRRPRPASSTTSRGCPRSCATAPDVLLCVDAITAIGVFDVPMDRWGLDVVCLGSQKALMLPPGLAMIGVSEKAWKANERSNLPRFYLDLARERKSQDKGETTSRPAVTLVRRAAGIAAHAQGRDARGRLQPPRAARAARRARRRAAWASSSSRRRRPTR